MRQRVVDAALAAPERTPRELAWAFTDREGYFLSESSVSRILKAYDLIASPAFVVLSAGKTFQHPTHRPNELWQTDFTYLHVVGGGWYSRSTVLDDDSRDILAWTLRPTMQATDVMETLDLARAATGVDQVQVAHRPRLLSDNGPGYISAQLATSLETHGLPHTRSAPYHPMTQGKIERDHRSLDDYLAGRATTVDAAGRRYVVRNGHLPSRAIQTPLGDVQVQQPRVRDRRPADEQETFRSAILPPYLRKTPSLEALYPWLYLKGISTGDFGDALQALLGSDARGLSATTITRLKAVWEQEYQDWSKRSLAHRGYAYVWADGVYFNVRLEDTDNKRQCILVLMGATREGTKELIAITDGYRESEQSWRELLLDVRHRGLTIDPESWLVRVRVSWRYAPRSMKASVAARQSAKSVYDVNTLVAGRRSSRLKRNAAVSGSANTEVWKTKNCTTLITTAAVPNPNARVPIAVTTNAGCVRSLRRARTVSAAHSLQPHQPPGAALHPHVNRFAIRSGAVDVTELLPRLDLGPRRCHALANQLLFAHLEVELHLGINIVLDLLTRPPREPKESSDRRHAFLP